MSIQKRGKKWRAVLRPKGSKAITKTFNTKKEAEEFHALKILELKENLININKAAVDNITLADFIRKINPIERPHEASQAKKYYHLKKLASYPISNISLSAVSTKDVLAFIEERKAEAVAQSTIIKDLTRLSAIYRQAEDLGFKIALKNPFSIARIRKHIKLNESHHRERRLTTSEETAILAELGDCEDISYNLATTEHETILFIKLALATGMRLGEILTLEKSQIFLNKSELILYRTKNGDRRYIPLSRQAKEILKILMQRKSPRLFLSTPRAIQDKFRQVCNKLNIKNLRPHDLRHEATHRLTKKLNVLEVAKILGHRDIKHLMIYYNPTSAEIAQKLDN